MKRIKQVLFAAAVLFLPLLIFADGGKKAGFKEAVHKALDSSEEIIKAGKAGRPQVPFSEIYSELPRCTCR